MMDIEEMMQEKDEIAEMLELDDDSEEAISRFFKLWPDIKEYMQSLTETDETGIVIKPALEYVDAENDGYDYFLFNLLSDVETALCCKEHAEDHLKFCREILDLIDTEAEESFFENCETGVGTALSYLGSKEESNAYFDKLLQKEPKPNYISSALQAAMFEEDYERLKMLIDTYVHSRLFKPEDKWIDEVAAEAEEEMKQNMKADD